MAKKRRMRKAKHFANLEAQAAAAAAVVEPAPAVETTKKVEVEKETTFAESGKSSKSYKSKQK